LRTFRHLTVRGRFFAKKQGSNKAVKSAPKVRVDREAGNLVGGSQRSASKDKLPHTVGLTQRHPPTSQDLQKMFTRKKRSDNPRKDTALRVKLDGRQAFTGGRHY